MFFMLWGAAGTGKTEMLKVLEQVMLRDCLGRIVFCAWMGVAAALLPHGMTMCAATGLNPLQFKLESRADGCSDKVRIDFQTLCGAPDEITMVVMDEVSTYGPKCLEHCSTRFCELLHGDKTIPFGGVVVLLPGDFLQLSPVGETSMFSAVVHHMLPGGMVPSAYGKKPKRRKLAPATSFSTMGVGTFRKFKIVRLTQQMRARLDERQCAALEVMRELENPRPISEEFVQWLESMVLSPKDMELPSVAFALMATASVKEALAYNWRTTKAFAKYHNRVIIRWAVTIPETAMPYLNATEWDELYKEEPLSLYQYYVQGAPGIMLKNFEKATTGQQAGLSNGTAIVYDSITLPDGAMDGVEVKDHIATLARGVKPKSINVLPILPKDTLNRLLAARVSCEAGRVVIPIKKMANYQRKTELISNHSARMGYPPQLELAGELPCEVAFANSDFKYQGRTIKDDFLGLPADRDPGSPSAPGEAPNARLRTEADAELARKAAKMAKLIVSLGERHFPPSLSLRGVYVMLSRVVLGAQLRVLPYEGDLSHLLELRHSEEIRLFDAAIDPATGFLCPTLLANAAMRLEAEGVAVAAKRKAEKAAKKRPRAAAKASKKPSKKQQQEQQQKQAAAGQKRTLEGLTASASKAPFALRRGQSPPRPGAGRTRDARALTASSLQGCKYASNSCHMDSTLEEVLAGLMHTERLTGTPLLQLPTLSEASTTREHAIVLQRLCALMELRAALQRGGVTDSALNIQRQLSDRRTQLRKALAAYHRAENPNCHPDLQFGMSNQWNADANVTAFICRPVAAENRNTSDPLPSDWLGVGTYSTCGGCCGGSKGRLTGRIFGLGIREVQTARNSSIFAAFVRKLRPVWRPCVKNRFGEGCSPGSCTLPCFSQAVSWGTRGAEAMPSLLAMTIDGTLAPVRLEADCLQVLRMPGFLAYYELNSARYHNGFHYSTTVKQPHPSSGQFRWVHFDGNENEGVGVPCGAAPTGDALQYGSFANSTYHVCSVIYGRTKLADVAAQAAIPLPASRPAHPLQQHRWCCELATRVDAAAPATLANVRAPLDPAAGRYQDDLGVSHTYPAPGVCRWHFASVNESALSQSARCRETTVCTSAHEPLAVLYAVSRTPPARCALLECRPQSDGWVELCEALPQLASQVRAAVDPPPPTAGVGSALSVHTAMCHHPATLAVQAPVDVHLILAEWPLGETTHSPRWHAAVQSTLRGALAAAVAEGVNTLVVGSLCGAGDASSVDALLGLLQSAEFGGAFSEVVLCCKTYDAHLRSAVRGWLCNAPSAGDEQLAEVLERHLAEAGWTDTDGELLTYEALNLRVVVPGWLSAEELGLAAAHLFRAGRWQLSQPPPRRTAQWSRLLAGSGHRPKGRSDSAASLF